MKQPMLSKALVGSNAETLSLDKLTKFPQRAAFTSKDPNMHSTVSKIKPSRTDWLLLLIANFKGKNA